MTEKQDIEKAVANAFIKLYNARMSTSYSIVEISDAPDVLCEDEQGRVLNLETTLTEDRPGDIQAALGKSNHRSVEALGEHMAKVREGKASIFDRVSCLQGNVVDSILARLDSKLSKDYGRDVALVIQDTSGVQWPWESVRDRLLSSIGPRRNPYDRGIWIVRRWGDESIRVM